MPGDSTPRPTETLCTDHVVEHLAETMGDGARAPKALNLTVVFPFKFFQYISGQSTQVTASNVKRTMHAMHGKDASASAAGSNAERDCQRLFQSKGLSLDVPIQSTEHPSQQSRLRRITTFHVTPQDWVRQWMNGCPELMSGLTANPCDTFESFWALYKLEHQNHEVFTAHQHELKNVIPILIHGDEGRAVKKQTI